MNRTGLLFPGLLLSLLFTACTPASDAGDLADAEADGEDVGFAREAVSFSGQTAGINDSSPLLTSVEHCLMPAALIGSFPTGRQVRLLRTDPAGKNHLALCTVRGQSANGRVEMTSAGLLARLAGAGTITGVTVQTIGSGARVTNSQSTILATYSGYTQDVREFSSKPSLAEVAYMAPHGRIELRTAEQVDRIFTNRTAGRDAFWVAGYHTTAGGIFSHLHIKSEDLSTASFPGLAPFVNDGMSYAVSFHGFDDADEPFEDDVLVGGQETTSFRKGVAEMINDALAGTGFIARHDLSDDVYRPFRGAHDNNFVNRVALGKRGLQLEQSKSLRDDPAAANLVADAVKSVYDCMVDASDDSRTTTGTFGSGGTAYTGGSKCPRFVMQLHLATNIGPVAVDAGKPAGCAPGRAHVDVYQLRSDGTWERKGGGFRTYDAACAVTNEPGYEPVSGIATPTNLRVVVQSLDAAGAADVASVTVN